MALACVSGGKECNGCMGCQPEPTPFYCPVCNEEVEEMVYKIDSEIIGCDACVEAVDVADIE